MRYVSDISTGPIGFGVLAAGVGIAGFCIAAVMFGIAAIYSKK